MSGRRSVPFRPPVSQGAVSPRRSKGTEPSRTRPGHRVRGHRLRLPMPVRSKPAAARDRPPPAGRLMLLYFFATYAVLVISFNLPFLIQQYKLTSSASGVMISLFFLAIMLPGLAVDRVIALLGKKTMFVSLLLIGAGLLLLYLMKSEFFVALGCFATGLGYGVISGRLQQGGRHGFPRTDDAGAGSRHVGQLSGDPALSVHRRYVRRSVSVLFVGRFPVFC